MYTARGRACREHTFWSVQNYRAAAVYGLTIKFLPFYIYNARDYTRNFILFQILIYNKFLTFP